MIRVKRKLNPTDEELLKDVKLVKNGEDNESAEFIIYYRNNVIGDFAYNKRNKSVDEIFIYTEKFRRKGIGTFIYDYIENVYKIKLKPSNILLDDGKAFWKNRSRKQLLSVLKTRTNPTDKDFLSKVKIQKVLNKEYISYEAFYNNKYIAGVDFNPKTKTIWDVWVGPNYRRKGLATFIYNKIEKDQKIKLKPSDTLFPDGQEFWKARLKTG